MYIRKCVKKGPKKSYTNYLLVESVMTPKGPRQKTICSLGNLKPRPREEWLALVRKVEDALAGQESFEGPDPEAEAIAAKVRARQKKLASPKTLTQTSGAAEAARSEPVETDAEIVSVRIGGVTTETIREAGPVHVGLSFYDRIGMDEELAACGLSPRARVLAQAMIMNRLIHPDSEHAMPNWIGRTALPDLLGRELEEVCDDSLYRNLDRLHPHREAIERGLAEREKNLFNLEDTIYLYDLTSTYFEGQALGNPAAQRGYSRDHRPDCKQVVIGLVIDRDGFPKAHEIFDGNRVDTTTLDEMLEALERRVGRKETDPRALVVVDRGMAYHDNLEQIRRRGHDYLVATRQNERDRWLAEFESEEGWKEVLRENSPNNPCQKKSRIRVRKLERGEETLVCCLSDDRVEKDRAIRLKKQARLVEDLEKLSKQIESGRLKRLDKIHQSIGRLLERYPRVARYHSIDYDAESGKLVWTENDERRRIAESLDGSYLLKTNRPGLEDDEIWRLYSLLTRAENAFRSMKSPLVERPIFHQLKHRVETHIFLCVLAYHLLVAVETTLRNRGIYTSWATVRKTLSTHHVTTVVLPTDKGDVLRIRKGSTPDPEVRELYRLLNVPQRLMKQVNTWHRAHPT
jgi:transposase